MRRRVGWGNLNVEMQEMQAWLLQDLLDDVVFFLQVFTIDWACLVF